MPAPLAFAAPLLLALVPAPRAAEPAPTTLTLADALARLDSANPDLAAVRARVDDADATARLALAPLLPAVLASGAYTRNDAEVVLSFSALLDQIPFELDTSGLPDDVTIQPLENWTATGALRVPILNVSGIADASAARAAARAAGDQADAARIQLQAGLVQACAMASAGEGLVEAARRAEEQAGLRRDAVHRAVVAGTLPPLAEIQAETDVVRRQSERVQAEADLAKLRRAIGALLGMDGPAVVTVPEQAEVLPASARAPELIAAEAQAEAARKGVSAARLRYLPTLTGSFTALAATTAFPTGDKTAWRAGLELSWTLLDGGAREARLGQAAARSSAAAAQAEAARIKVDQQIADAERDLGVARERRALAEQALVLARRAEKVAQGGLEAGTVTPLDARDAEETAFRADVQVQQARAGEAVAAATLRRARGQGW